MMPFIGRSFDCARLTARSAQDDRFCGISVVNPGFAFLTTPARHLIAAAFT